MTDRIADELRRNHWRLASHEAIAARDAARAGRRLDLTCPVCTEPFSRIRSQIVGAVEDACCSKRCAAKHLTARGVRRRPFRPRNVRPVEPERPYVAPEPTDFRHYADFDDVPIGKLWSAA